MENLPVKIVPCPTVREPDGLAMSSRNGYLSEAKRAIAPGLYRVVNNMADELRQGVSNY